MKSKITKLVANDSGIRAMLTSNELYAVMESIGQQIAADATALSSKREDGPLEYRVERSDGAKTRARVRVGSNSDGAKNIEAKHGFLLKAARKKRGN